MTQKRFSAPRSIFWTALALRVIVILIGHTYRINPSDDHFHFGFEAGRIARSLVLGHGYASPFNGQTGPTAWLPPLYPLLIALSFKLFGIYTSAAALFLLILNSIASAAIAPAVYEIAARCFDTKSIVRRSGTFFPKFNSGPADYPVALWSAWLWAVYPAALQYAIHWIWEMSVSTCLFTWIIVLTLRLRHTGEPSDNATQPQITRWLAFGLLWGLLMLSNASLLLCLPAMLLWIAAPSLRNAASSRTQLLTITRGALLACITLALVMAPWIIRNQRTLHAFVPTRSNLPIEMYQSTLFENDGFPWGTTLPLWTGDPEFQRYTHLGEIQYAKLRGAEATARIKAMPTQILRWDIDRFFFFWDGTPHPMERHPAQEYGRQLSYSFLSLSGLLGLALMLRRCVEGAALFGLIFLLMPLPYYLLTVQPRFRHPIEPLVAILAVYLFRSTEPKQPVPLKPVTSAHIS